jgi:hypothetical protein
MLEKKLLTLAGALGILACGACFLPPLPEHRSPLPQLQGVRRIRVVVASSSDSQHVDPSALAQAVAFRINLETSGTGAKAYVGDKAEDRDGILYIAVLKASATPGSAPVANGLVLWSLDLTISATLTDSGGRVVWQEEDGDYRLSRSFPPKDPAEIWNDPIFRNWLARSAGDRLVERMLHHR